MFKMCIRNFILILLLVFSLSSCKTESKEKTTTEIVQENSSDLQVDHFNIWVNNPESAKQKLKDIGFTLVPDSLSQIHKGQGTAGKYVNFLNGYLELIYVYNQKELEDNNTINRNLDFVERANFEKNNASPFSIAFKVKDYNIEKIPFEKVKYHQSWMDENANIYSAKNSKTNLNEPSVFVIYPEIESTTFESLSVLQNIPSEDDFWKIFFKHQNGAKKVTDIIISSTTSDLNTETIKAVNEVDDITIKSANEHLMELYFDNNIQKKSFDLRPELPLIIHL